MDIPKILRRLLALRRMAKGQEGTPEGDNAAHHANAWAEKHGLDIPEEALETTKKIVEFEHFWERELLVYIGHMLDLEVRVKKSDEGPKEVWLTGIQVITDEAASLYEHHHKALERIVNFAMVGYILGAMPEGIGKNVEIAHSYEDLAEPPEPSHISEDDLDDPSLTERVIAKAARDAGKEESRPLWQSLMTKEDHQQAQGE